MRIQHNIMAMNAYRNLGANNRGLSKNLEKLASGYRINRAGDDAAGLAISEKMRAQLAGLDQAQSNAQSGINLVQTAEGALTEVHDMLNRMTTLATQSANGTYDAADRDKLQAEVNALIDEIDRIAENSNFNGTKLLDGSLSEKEVKASLSSGTNWAASSTTYTAAVNGDEKTTFEIDLSGVEFDFIATSAGAAVSLEITGTATGSIALTNLSADASAEDLVTEFAKTTQVAIDGVTFNVRGNGTKLVFTMSDDSAKSKVAASFNGNFGVTITTNAGTCGTLLGGVNTGTKLISQGVAASKATMATAKTAAISATDIEKDGKTFQVGNDVYVLALTEASAKKTYDSEDIHVIDLSDLVATDSTGALKLIQTDSTGTGTKSSDAMFDVAMQRIVKTMDETNEMFSVGLDKTNALTFRQRETYDGDVDLADAGVLAKQFQVDGSIKVSTEIHEENQLQLQIGAGQTETIKVGVNSMKAFDLGLKGLDISSSVDAANKAIETVKNAIQTVSATRGDLGAIQNRLEHTINNLGVMEENVQDAESNIRDTDIADEMMAYTKNNILIQSAQAMLAQANQTPQGVLQLMQ